MLSKTLTMLHETWVWLRITLMLVGAFAIAWGAYQGWKMQVDVTDLNVSVYRK